MSAYETALRLIADRPFTSALDAREMREIARDALTTGDSGALPDSQVASPEGEK